MQPSFIQQEKIVFDCLFSVVYTVQNLIRFTGPMTFTTSDVVSLTLARANLSELADQVKAGSEKIITKNGESYVALIDAERLDYYHRLEREHIHLLLLDEVEEGLADVKAGRTRDSRTALVELKRSAKDAVSRKR
mgnify:CR=1 FL=1